MDNYTSDQVDKALRLCDLLGLQDITLATTILQDLDWDIQKAVQMMMDNSTAPQNQTLPRNNSIQLPQHYANAQQQQQYQQYQQPIEDNQNLFEYQYDREQKIKDNKRTFNEAYQPFKLDRSTSEVPEKLERRLSDYRKIMDNFGRHRHSYQCHLMQQSQKFCKKFLDKKQQQRVGESIIKNQNNRNFISYLSKNYRCQINFTFGTFHLNLVRSYLDKKCLLVYIHKRQFQDSRCLQMLLSNNQIAKFINDNCISYGMFDNSDDYDILQKYVPLKELPAFALFKFDKNNKKQRFLASYQILQKQPSSIMEWLATSMGIPIKKKQQPKKQQQISQKSQSQVKKNTPNYSHRSIMFQQNQQYQQMQRVYKLRRQQSKIKKQQIAHAQAMIQKMKQNFKQQLKLQQGKTIQIKFRLPQTGKSLTRVFNLNSKVKDMFDYINCFGRNQFQQKFANFDLAQTFPSLSLIDKQNKIIHEIFQSSNHQNIIVKQL